MQAELTFIIPSVSRSLAIRLYILALAFHVSDYRLSFWWWPGKLGPFLIPWVSTKQHVLLLHALISLNSVSIKAPYTSSMPVSLRSSVRLVGPLFSTDISNSPRLRQRMTRPLAYLRTHAPSARPRRKLRMLSALMRRRASSPFRLEATIPW